MSVEAIQRFCFPVLDVDHGVATAATEDASALGSEEAIAAAAAANVALAQLRAESSAAGFAAGHAEGVAAGREEAARQTVDERRARDAAVARIETQLQRAAASLDGALTQAVVDVVRAAVSAVVRVELHTNALVLQSLAATALAHLRETVSPLSLVVNPEDRALLDEALSANTALTVRADAALSRGDLRLETGEGSVEVSLTARLRAALAELERPLP